jgi:hypothetical protein
MLADCQPWSQEQQQAGAPLSFFVLITVAETWYKKVFRKGQTNGRLNDWFCAA